MKDDDDEEGGLDRLGKAADALAAMKPELDALARDLADANSRFPATRAFLKVKGVENVMELSPADRLQLKAYLEAELAALTGGTKKPSN